MKIEFLINRLLEIKSDYGNVEVFNSATGEELDGISVQDHFGEVYITVE